MTSATSKHIGISLIDNASVLAKGRLSKPLKYTLVFVGTALVIAGVAAVIFGTLGIAGVVAIAGLALAYKIVILGGGIALSTTGMGVKDIADSNSHLTLAADLNSYTNGECKHGIGFINGIANRPKDVQMVMSKLIEYAGTSDPKNPNRRRVKLYQVYNATHNPILDLTACIAGKLGHYSPPVYLLHRQWDQFFDKNPQGQFLQICHSQGALHTHNALKSYDQGRVKRITVLALAPAKTIQAELCAIATNIASTRDFIPFLSSDREELVHKEPHPEAQLLDHGVLSPTFAETIHKTIETFIRSDMAASAEPSRKKPSRFGLPPFNPKLAVVYRVDPASIKRILAQ